jgi:predicted dehydrogenase
MKKIRTIVVGTGGMAQYHLRAMLGMQPSTSIVGLVEVSEPARQATRALFAKHKVAGPPFYDTIAGLIRAPGAPDAALICTPHKFHFENTRDCLLNGVDVCLEKPMVMNAAEARRLIRLRDRTGRLLVVAFPGSLSPAVRKAKQLLARGAIGRVTAMAAFAHQSWKKPTTGTWRQDPDISGGGFLFDTGSHMINTVVDLLGEEVAEVTALLDHRGTPVEIASSVSGRSRSGVLLALAGAGDSVQCCSLITVFGDRGVLQTGIWGERLLLKRAADSEYTPVPLPKSRGVWEAFVKVRQGRAANPCPPEVGLRFARLMDMIRRSAETGRTVRSPGRT